MFARFRPSLLPPFIFFFLSSSGFVHNAMQFVFIIKGRYSECKIVKVICLLRETEADDQGCGKGEKKGKKERDDVKLYLL